MARKYPFHNIRVSDRIIKVLIPLIKKASQNQFRTISTNAYCEQVLWGHAKKRTKLSREK